MEDKPISVHCETYTDIGVFRTTGRSEFASSVQRGILQPSEVTDLSTPVVLQPWAAWPTRPFGMAHETFFLKENLTR